MSRASTDRARRPTMPPTLSPGVCRFCREPTVRRLTKHEECETTWRESNDPTVARLLVLARDDYTCRDCGRRYLAQDLEADHIDDDGLADDDDPNHPSKKVTRCVPCHRDKSARASRARNTAARSDRAHHEETPMPRTTTRAQQTDARPAPTPLVGAPPRITEGWQGMASLYAFDAVGATATHFTGHEHAITAGAVVAAVMTAARAAAHHDAARTHARTVSAQQLFEGFARITHDPVDARAQRMTVRRWDGLRPVQVDLTTGSRFEGTDHDLQQLQAAMAAHVGAHGLSQVTVERMPTRKGAVITRLRFNPDAIATSGGQMPADDADVAREPDEVQERIAAALGGVLTADVDVTVEHWHAPGVPARVTITYPPAVTARVSNALVDLRDTMTRLHPPHEDEWFLDWHSADDVLVFADRPDPLAPIVRRRDPERDLDLLRGPVVADTAGGAPWHLPLMGGKHTLIAGATGSGKGSVIWSIISSLEHLIRDGLVRLWLIDPKGGVELDAAAAYAYRFAVTGEEQVALLTEAAKVMSAKAAGQRGQGRKVATVTRERPLDLVIIDELAAVVGDVADPAHRPLCDAAVKLLLTQGRAPAFTVVAAVQDPRKDNIKLRQLFTNAIALRLSDAVEANMVLGRGARAQGAVPDLIPTAHAGIAYVTQDGRAGVDRIRFPWISDDDIDALAARLTPKDAPPIGAPVVGEQLALAKAPRPGPVRRPGPAPVAVVASGKRVSIEALSAGTLFVFDDAPGVPARAMYDEETGESGGHQDPEDPDRWRLSFRYDGEQGKRVATFDADEMVTLLT